MKRASSNSSPLFFAGFRCFFTVATAREPFPLLLLAAASPAAWSAAGRLPPRLDLDFASAEDEDEDDEDEDDEDEDEDDEDDGATPFMEPAVKRGE